MYAHEYFRGVFAVYQCKTLSDGVCKGELYSKSNRATLAYMTSSSPEPLGIFWVAEGKTVGTVAFGPSRL